MITDVAGLLGFCLSIVVFALTRWERRKKLAIQLDTSDYPNDLFDGSHEAEFMSNQERLVTVRITNIGGRSVIIDKSSLVIKAKGKVIKTHDCDWLGIDQIPVPLTVSQSCVVAVFEDTFEHLLDLVWKHDHKGAKSSGIDSYPISVDVTDLEGRVHSPQTRYLYMPEVSDFCH